MGIAQGGTCVWTIVRAMAIMLAAIALGASSDSASAAAWQALVTNDVSRSNTVSVIDTGSNAVTTNVGVGTDPAGIAITPDGSTAYVANAGGESISQVDVASGTVVQTISTSPMAPLQIAIAPDGRSAWVTFVSPNTDFGTGDVAKLDLTTSTPTLATPISDGATDGALDIAISPDGTTGYVTNPEQGTVTPIDLADSTPGTAIPVGTTPMSAGTACPSAPSSCPDAIAIAPDGSKLYVADQDSHQLSIVDLDNSDQVTNVSLPAAPRNGIAVSPDGSIVYVAAGSDVVPVNTGTKTALTAIPVTFSDDMSHGVIFPVGVAPDGRTVYVGDGYFGGGNGPFGDQVVAIPVTAAGAANGTQTTVQPLNGQAQDEPWGIAITPDQAPVANFTVASAPPGSATTFDASSSTVAFGSIASYAWDFGDGSPVVTTSVPTVTHVYAATGSYTATITETDNIGTSTTTVYTGHSMLVNGGPSAEAVRSVIISSAQQPQAQLSTADLAFGTTGVGRSGAPQTVTVSDTGQAPLTISSAAIGGANPNDFSLSNDACTGHTIAAGGTCTAEVTFSPSAAGPRSAALAFTDNASGSPHTLQLTGAGITTGTLTGTVRDGTSPGAPPIAGASILLVKQGSNGMLSGPTLSTQTDSAGQYSFSCLGLGAWLVQVSPVSANLFGASALDQIVAGAQTQDFTLQAPIGLSGGVAFTTPEGDTTSGVPVVNWAQPTTVNFPIQISNTGPADTDEPYVVEFGVSGAGLNQAGLVIFDVAYDGNGLASAISNFVAGPVISGDAAAVSSVRRAEDRPACCQQGGDQTIASWMTLDGDLGVIGLNKDGVPFVDPAYNDPNVGGNSRYTLGDGVTVPSITIPTQIGPIDITTPGANAVNNTGPIKLTQVLKPLFQLAKDPHGPAARTVAKGVAKFEINQATHGAAKWVQNTFGPLAGALAKAVGKPLGNALQQPVNFWIDPSGTVMTTQGAPIAGAKVVIERSAGAKGRLTQVPNGSAIMSPANRRNPSFTDPLGSFGWDVLPGWYRVVASRAGCTAPTGRSRQAKTRRFKIPPPVDNLVLRLRCPNLHRASTRTRLHVKFEAIDGQHHMMLVASIAGGRRRGHVFGSVGFYYRGRLVTTSPVDPKTGEAEALVLGKTAARDLSARFTGDASLAPSSATG